MGFKPKPNKNDSVKAKKALTSSLEMFANHYLKGTKFIFSDTPSIADFSFGVMVLYMLNTPFKDALPQRIQTYLADLEAAEGSISKVMHGETNGFKFGANDFLTMRAGTYDGTPAGCVNGISKSIPELSYFDATGRANLARLAFLVGGTPFKDNRVANWPEVKADSSSVPSQLFGSMPVIEHDGLLIGTSIAASIYAADLGGLLGSSAADRATCTMVVTTNEDLKQVMLKGLFGDDESKAAGLAALPEASGKFLSALERALKRKGTDGPFFLGGDSPSVADLAVFDNVHSDFPGLLKLGVDLAQFPKVVACASAVGAIASVKEFVVAGWKLA